MLTEVPPRRSTLAADSLTFPGTRLRLPGRPPRRILAGSSIFRSGRRSIPRQSEAMLALSRAANSPGYPLTSGTAALREAIASYLTRRWGG